MPNEQWFLVLDDGETYAPAEGCTLVRVSTDVLDVDAVVKAAVRAGAGYEVMLLDNESQITSFGQMLIPNRRRRAPASLPSPRRSDPPPLEPDPMTITTLATLATLTEDSKETT